MEPKYRIGQKVWWIGSSKKIEEVEITGVRVGLTYKKEKIFYYGVHSPQDKYGTIYIQEEEDVFFTSKEDLIKSL